jgi:outer membrane lipoprotein-sorting protein
MKHTRRGFARLALLFLAASLLMGAGQAPPPRRIEFTAQQREDLDRVSAFLNGIHTLSAAFVQMNEQGNISQGGFFLSRPGKLRFEYRPPSPTLVVATGGKIYVKNGRLNTVDSYDTSDTPLGLLLADTIDLKRNPAVLGIDRRAGELVLRARSSTNRLKDNINIVFATEPQLAIRSWTVRDAQGGSTSIALSQMQMGAALNDALFAVPVRAPVIRKGGN